MALRVLAAASISFGSPLGLRQLRRGSTTPELVRARMLLSFPVGRKVVQGRHRSCRPGIACNAIKEKKNKGTKRTKG